MRLMFNALVAMVLAVVLTGCGNGPASSSSPRAEAPTIALPTATATTPPTAAPEPILIPTATPTAAPEPPTAVPTQPIGPTVNDTANLRSGPGTDFDIVSSVVAGTPLFILGQTAAGDWYQLSDNVWIAAALVTGAPSGLAVVDLPSPEPLPTEAPATPVPTVTEPTSSAFTCIGGCAVAPDPTCNIKGNVNSKGEQIYHTTESPWYDRTDIKPEEGDRWFCTTQEAEAAGFRAPKN